MGRMVSGASKEESILILCLWSATCSVQGPPLHRGGWLSGLGRTLSGMPMPIQQERLVDAPSRISPYVVCGGWNGLLGNGRDGVSIYSVRRVRVAVLMMMMMILIESKSFLGGNFDFKSFSPLLFLRTHSNCCHEAPTLLPSNSSLLSFLSFLSVLSFLSALGFMD